MYKLLTLLLLVACSTQPINPPKVDKPNLLLSKLEVGKVTSREIDINAISLVDPSSKAEVLTTIRVVNHTDVQRLQWVTSTIPFPPYKIYNQQLLKISTTHGAISVTPIKWHFRDGVKAGVAIAKLKFPLFMEPRQVTEVPIYLDEKHNPLPYAFGPLLSAMLKKHIDHLMFYGLKLKGDSQIYYAAMWQNPKLLESTTHSYTFRWQSNFKGGGKTLGMTANWYLTLNNRQDFGDLVLSVGHNDFDILKSGGYEVEYVNFYSLKPFNVQVRNAASYGVSNLPDQDGFRVTRLLTNQNVADGSARTFRGLWSLVLDPTSLNGTSYQAELESPLLGVANKSTWESTKAGGIVGTLSVPRGTLKQMRDDLKSLCGANYDVRISAYPKMANKNPSQTGDQPAFGSNMMAFQQQALLTGSSCPIEWALHGAQVEEYRPGYWWKDGRRMQWTDTPKTCFFWSGRPHYHHSHWGSNHCDEWKTRSTHTGFEEGDTHRWSTEDDQHWGNPLLRSLYEMTGDVWAKDVLEYRMSLALWNKMGDYSWQQHRLGSERAVRTAYNAVELHNLNPDHPIAKELLPRLVRRIKLRHTGGCYTSRYCSWGMDRHHLEFGVYALETIYGDGRHSVFLGLTAGGKCVNGKPCEQNRGVISWWSGFSMTFAYQMLKYGFAPIEGKAFIHKYMTMADFYWKTDGWNVGGRRLNDWNVTESSFTQSWHTGWLSATELGGKDHPKWSFFRDKVIPTTRKNAFNPDRPGDLWTTKDKWWQ